MSTLTSSPAWQSLVQHKHAIEQTTMRELFANDPDRFAKLSREAVGVFVDYSKHRITAETLGLLIGLAKQADVESWREKMFTGEKINITEDRAVLHVALRNRRNMPILVDGKDVMPEVNAVLAKMWDFTERVRDGRWKGHTGETITDIVNIGIGGSDLGPVMATEALRPYWKQGMNVHFVSNIDGTHIVETLKHVDPARTLFIVASKTFTTQETITNAKTARAWLVKALGADAAVAKHFVALSTNAKEVAGFGIDTANMFEFWDWVGGRYSLWSAIGLSLAIAVGADGFREFLAGAHAMDEHFRSAPLAHNLPVQLALVDVWYRNFHGFTSRSVAPYHHALKRLPAYLQQLEMESNGKRVDRDGHALGYGTSPVVWGEPGTNGQHAYFQMLHQGTDTIPVEFILVKESDASAGGGSAVADSLARQQRMLLANGLAQAQALMLGRSTAEALAERPDVIAGSAVDAATLAAHRSFPGNRPSTTVLLDRLTPRSLGALIALYEHRVFTSGAVWGIDSFDQWGVELGKGLSARLLPLFDAPLAEPDLGGLDPSTAGLLRRLRS